jgi:hypothetical protein
MVNPGAVVTAVASIAVGAVFVFDYRGVSTRMKSQTEAWWRAGPIRRRIPQNNVSPRWAFGAPLMFMGIVALLAIFA